MRWALMMLVAVPAMWPSNASAATASTGTPGCTITVTRTMHVVHGTRGADRICVIGRGRHVIYAGGGNDIIWDGAASDQIYAGAGADIIYGGGGNDLVDGGRGADQLYGEGGNDTLTADAGSDSVYGGDGSDTVSGNSGSDSLSGGDGSDTVSGGDGSDWADGDGGNDVVSGGGGDDTVSGGDDADTLTGDAGNDHVFGGPGDDDLSGGAGTNTCDGGGGVDHLDLTCDSTPPTLVWLRFSDTQVDTSVGPIQVTITARFTDDLSGFDQASVGVGTIGAVFHQSDRISGDSLDGTYRTTLYLYQYMPQGTWPIRLSLQDAVGNRDSLTSSDLQELDQPWQFTQAGPGDDTAPTVSNLVLNSTTLDTSAGSASVTATVHAEDDLSGFDWLNLIVDGPAGQVSSLYFDHFQRISGTSLSGDYSGEMTLQQYAPQGDWHIVGGFVGDNALNTHTLTADELTALLGGSDTITQTGAGDITAPQVTSLAVTSDGADPATSPVNLTFDLQVTDDLAGVSHADCDARSPNGVLDHTTYLGWINRISGDDLDGAYQNVLQLSQYSPPGVWAVKCLVYDYADNYSTVTTTVQVG